MVRRALVLASLAAACQGSKPEPPVAGDASGSGSGVAGFGSSRRHTEPADGSSGGSGSGSDGGSGSGSGGADAGSDDAPPVAVEPAALGAIPAWQAVVDRTRYLERRKQHGIAYGLLGGEVMVAAPAPEPTGSADAGVPLRGDAGLVASPYVWLADDTEGNGALAVRVRLPDSARVHPVTGDRVALGGAWALDADRRWYWKVDTITALPAPPPPKPTTPPTPVTPPAPPGHVIATGDLPGGSRTISLAKEGELAYFQLVGQPPATDGDGWPVADELGNPVYALLALPGERASYGAQDLRTPDERWSLRRGVTYVVRLGHIRKHDGKPATINARTAPVRVL